MRNVIIVGLAAWLGLSTGVVDVAQAQTPSVDQTKKDGTKRSGTKSGTWTGKGSTGGAQAGATRQSRPASAAVPAAAPSPPQAQGEAPREKKHDKTGAIAAGLAAAAIGAILLGKAAEAQQQDDGRDRVSNDEDRQHARNCRRWDRMCDDGNRWACRKLEHNCE